MVLARPSANHTRGTRVGSQSLQSIKSWKDLFLMLILKRFQRLCHDQPDFDILLGKLTAQIGCLKGWEFHAKSGFFFDICSSGLYFDALNLKLFRMFLVISQSLEKVVKGVCWCAKGEVGNWFGLEGKRGLPGGTGGWKETMYGVIVVIFLGLGGEKRWGRCFNFIIWDGKSQKGNQFLWGEFLLYNIDILKLLSPAGYCKSLYRIPVFTILAVLPVLYLLIYNKLKACINVCIT